MVLKRHQGNSQKEVAGDLVSYGEVMTITVGSMAGRHWSSSRDERANQSLGMAFETSMHLPPTPYDTPPGSITP